MKNRVHYLGVLGLIVFAFGLLTYFLVSFDQYYFMHIHVALGVLLIVLFVVKGGLRPLGSAAAQRAAGFGAGMTLYTALFIGILSVLNVGAYRFDPFYFDSTEQNVFTLAPQTSDLLQDLPDAVLARFFAVGGRVNPELEDLLNRLSRQSGNFRWEIVDPETTPELADYLGVSERDTLHFSYDGKDSSRAVKISRKIDEQEVVNALLKLTRGGKKMLYWVSGHGESNLDDPTEAGFLFLKEAIEGENVTVTKLELAGGEPVPSDAAAILVMAPRRSLLAKERNAIRRYLESGGGAVFATEPNTTSDVAALVRPFGVIVGSDVILDQEVRLLEGKSVGVRPMISDYGQHQITENFSEGSIYSTASSVRTAPVVPSGMIVSELAFTGPNSWAESNVAGVFSEKPTAAIDPEDVRGPLALAAAAEGIVAYEGYEDDSFELVPENPASETVSTEGEAEKETEEASEAIKKGKSRIVVFGDADFVANVNIRQLFNRDFFLNSLNWVLGETENISIRAKSLKCTTKALTTKEFRSMFLIAGILLPEAVLILGITVWWRRRQS